MKELFSMSVSIEDINRYVCEHLLIGCRCFQIRSDQLFDVLIQLTRKEFLLWQQENPNVGVFYASLADTAMRRRKHTLFCRVYWRELIEAFDVDYDTLALAYRIRGQHQKAIILLGSTKKSPLLRIIGRDVVTMIARMVFDRQLLLEDDARSNTFWRDLSKVGQMIFSFIVMSPIGLFRNWWSSE